jgi:GalNAc-alpha-(1->4)-GalNAc-alpha-(1->3)-diNAcBac-PP-undecaprenol alpha-1,4-N-acetyl-D-galactosaminyltransferase
LRIAFLIASLANGGAEGVAAALCNTWRKNNHQVDILTFQAENASLGYKLAPGVNYHPLNLMKDSPSMAQFALNNLWRVRKVRRQLKLIQPDILVAFVTDTNVIAIIAAKSLNIPVVISERVHPGAHPISGVRAFLRKRLYPLANRLVVQTTDIAAWAKENLNVKAEVIPNPVDPLKFHSQKTLAGKKRIIAIGRFTRQKGFDLLIEAFHPISQKFPEWDLVIFGDGPERKNLVQQIEAAQLSSRISLPGRSNEIETEFAASEIYVHPARYEGFPNALLEALATGLCCIVADCPGGAGEIIRQGEFGLMIESESVEKLTEAMDAVISDPSRRKSFAGKAQMAVRGFNLDDIAEKWLRVMERAIGYSTPN